MQLTVATWNINSVRLRLDQVGRFLGERRPDVLCLQETKCPDERMPLEGLRAFGYPHVAHAGIKGYNGVAILSRLPFERLDGLDLSQLLRAGGRRCPRPDLGPALRSAEVFRAARSWERPSDHVPVTATLEL